MHKTAIGVLRDTTFRVDHVRAVRCDPTWRVNAMPFADYDLWYVTEGSARIAVNGVHNKLWSGNLFLFKPGDLLWAEHNAEERFSVFLCHFSALGSPGFDRLRWPRILRETPAYLGSYFERIIEGTPEAGDQSLLHAGFLYAALAELLGTGSLMMPHDSHANRREALFRQIVDYMTRHMDRRITIRALASRYGIERSTMHRLFFDFAGESPMEYLRLIRMQEARRLLDRGMSVKVVSAAVGYGDPYSFSKAFKRAWGSSPGHLRDFNT